MNRNNNKIAMLLLCSVMVCGSWAQTKVYTPEQCRTLALEHNAKMKKADNNIMGAEQTRKEAFTKYFPTVSATGGYFNANHDILKSEIKPGEFISPDAAAALPPEIAAIIPQSIPLSLLKDGTVAGVTAIQPVFAGGQIVNNNKLAAIAVEVNRLQKQQTANEVTLTAEKYYRQLVNLKEKMVTVKTMESMLDKLCKDVSKSVEVGVTTRNELLQVQLKQNDVAVTKIKLDNGIRLSKMLLAQYMGVSYTDSFDVSSPDIADSLPVSPDELHSDHQSSLALTPEYQLLQRNVKAKSLATKLEVGKNLPSLAVGAGFMYYNMLDTHRSFGTVFATLSVPISSWWGGSHAIKRKKLEQRNAELDMADNGEMLVINMQKVWNELDDAYKQVGIARKSIEQSEENLRLNNDYYKAGTTTMTDLLNAQSMFQQSHDKYVDAYSQYEIKKLEYMQVTGR